MNNRLKHFLNVFYRLAQVDVLNEVEIYVMLKCKHISEAVNLKVIPLETVAIHTPDLDQEQLQKAINRLVKKKYLSSTVKGLVLTKKTAESI
ncbi:MAG: hypothetical protein JXQ86_04100 [Methylophilaceae bacterium]